MPRLPWLRRLHHPVSISAAMLRDRSSPDTTSTERHGEELHRHPLRNGLFCESAQNHICWVDIRCVFNRSPNLVWVDRGDFNFGPSHCNFWSTFLHFQACCHPAPLKNRLCCAKIIPTGGSRGRRVCRTRSSQSFFIYPCINGSTSVHLPCTPKGITPTLG